MAASRAGPRGQSIVETIVGIMVLIPIALFLIDIGAVVLGNIANDQLAKTAARAAGSATDPSLQSGTAIAGYNAALTATQGFAESPIINKPAGGSFLTAYCWNGYGTPDFQSSPWPGGTPPPSIGDVAVITTMKIKLPIPFPFLPEFFEFKAKNVEPIVSIAAGQTDPSGGYIDHGAEQKNPPAP